jgi:hypothetical protein
MKVFFKHMVSGYVGSADDMIYYYDPRVGRILARRNPHTKATEKNHAFGRTVQNLMDLKPSRFYIDDLLSYAERSYAAGMFNGMRPVWTNLYMKIMFAMARQDPHIDLLTLPRAEIVNQDLPCRSVARAVAAGLLPEVRNWHQLTAEM